MIGDWRKKCQLEHRQYLQDPTNVFGQTDLDGLMKIMRSFLSQLGKKKPEPKQAKEVVSESYKQQSIEELKAAADKEYEETRDPEGPLQAKYMEMLEQQRIMNPEEALGELETVSELWTPETSPDEVAHALRAEQSAEAEKTEGAPKKKKKSKGGKRKKKAGSEEDVEESQAKKAKTISEPAAQVELVDAGLLSAIAPETQEQEEDETNKMRRRIYQELMHKGAFAIAIEKLMTPHWAWRERDLNWRHVDELTKGIVAEPFKTTKPPIVQPIEPK